MKFRQHLKLEKGLDQINMAPFIDVIFLLFIFFMLTSTFSFQTGISVRLPKAVTSDALVEENFIISITSEDVVYLNDKVVTIKELARKLSEPAQKNKAILIKADRRASMGRIVDIWDLCRKEGVEKINIATNRDQ